MVNGVAMANPDKIAWCLGSDGAQQEGNDSEAARLAAARNLNVKLVIDDNNVTIAGHPQDYLKGYNVEKTLEVFRRPCVPCCAALSTSGRRNGRARIARLGEGAARAAASVGGRARRLQADCRVWLWLTGQDDC